MSVDLQDGQYSPAARTRLRDEENIQLAPLQSSRDDAGAGENGSLSNEGVNEISEPQDEGEQRLTFFTVKLVTVAAISGLLFGYDTSAISGALVNIQDDLGALSDWQKEQITSSTTLGALIGGLGSGALSDYTGRKPLIGIASALFILGAVQQAWSGSVWSMCLGRLIVGLGVGQASCIVPLYIGELGPSRLRGRLVTVNCVMITLGQVIAYLIGMIYQYTPGGWRWMLGLGAIPAMIQLFSLAVLPESPRYLLLQSRRTEARAVLVKIYPYADDEQVDARLSLMMAGVRQSTVLAQSSTWLNRLRSLLNEGPNRRALVIGSGLQAFQQLTGINTALYYSATLFASLGFRNAIGVGCVVALANFAFTLVALRLVDSLGRRKTMLYSLSGMASGLILMAAFFHYLPTRGDSQPSTDSSSFAPGLIVAAMLIYVSFYAIGMGNIPWQQGELFRLDVRGLGTSICTATNWSCNLLVAATFLSLLRVATPSGAFILYAVICLVGWTFCLLLYPETSGLSLEEVYELFKDDFGVQQKSRSLP
ncbi:general substrate transporter [Kockovaella imperatae]|uniref:General substrate transporter n=1 Tax=Kockovaella imperatae TaxID=4999 RepID=A0A1Y1UFX0_9TREE|nr:general substrate transporter [Kockovaella imperatae]ORX36912.1 general substrate transporter [Kockovaella imperatae]